MHNEQELPRSVGIIQPVPKLREDINPVEQCRKFDKWGKKIEASGWFNFVGAKIVATNLPDIARKLVPNTDRWDFVDPAKENILSKVIYYWTTVDYLIVIHPEFNAERHLLEMPLLDYLTNGIDRLRDRNYREEKQSYFSISPSVMIIDRSYPAWLEYAKTTLEDYVERKETVDYGRFILGA